MTRKTAEEILADPKQALSRGWWLDGAGPARFGWAYQHPCKTEFIGATIQICVNKAQIVFDNV